jgi:predicted dehydrogenase
MVHATAIEGLGRRVRVGMVGGGRNAFIGAVHRMAMRLDDLVELRAGALSADTENARASAADLGLSPDRAYVDYREMATKEAARPDGVEAVVIVTPNHLHYPVAKAFLEAGIDVICDKPLSATLAEAKELVGLAARSGLAFAVTLNNTGYPMVRQAREMVAAGDLGDLRLVHASYIQDWLTNPIDAAGHKQAEWRTDPERAGVSACLADIGVHAHNLALFVTGLTIYEVSADLATFVPGRRLDDNAHVLLRFRGGARGVLTASQVAVGNLNNLSLKVYGTRAGLEWSGESPELLRFTPYGEPSRTLQRGGPGTGALAADGSRMPAGHPEGYIEGFANIYRGAAELVAARRAGRRPSAIALLTPTVEDGAVGVAFVEAAVASSRNNGAWTAPKITSVHGTEPVLTGRKE